MNSVAWYSRLTIWITALVLLVEAVGGRSFGLLTVLAICAMAAAFVGFVGALAVASLMTSTALITSPAVASRSFPSTDMSPRTEPPTVVTEPAPQTERASVTEVPVDPDPAEPELTPAARESVAARATVVPLDALPSTPPIEPVAPGRVRLATVEADTPLQGAMCLQCHQTVKLQQVVAVCPECGAAHHVTCWIENRFHCAREGCSGHGSLEEPGI
jgi:hypothetical protein